MSEERKYLLVPLHEGADFTLYRGREGVDQMPILALAVAAEHPSPQSLRRLECEYSLAAELGEAWAARPLALTRHQGRAMLILKDPGGEPLGRVIGQHNGLSLDLTRFLRIAIGLAAALGQAHRQGLIHKDIKPENVLVSDDGDVWLTGFGIASRLPRERQAPASPEIIAGTLAYMSPEQTGRMNRSMDTRSDLYSLGVTLYQMLTGVLPFTAADPLEWVHCHIARQPTAPIDLRMVPEPMSAIVMKLLAKNAEDRYQTAAGLEADLRRCLTDWQSHGRVDPFPLGTDDLSDRLLILEKLYGREREVEALLAAFDRVVAQGTAELVLVSGYSGVGKSSVVNELHKVLVPPRGLFAAGKFDQYKRDVPYATLAEAFQMLVREILVKSEVEVGLWRNALMDALGPNGQLMVNLIPELEFIIGKQPPVAELPPQEARGRFQLVFRRFLGAFARPEHPLALFLDDLQWLDTATLELLERLATDPDVRHVLLVGAYRDNEVDAAHPLVLRLAAIRDVRGTVEEIRLTPLSSADLARLIADAFHCDPQRAVPLAQLVHEKTAGNAFFAIQFLHTLVEERLITFQHAAARWCWDLDAIRAKGYTDNVVNLILGKLSRLPAAAQKALRQLACIGNSAAAVTLAAVFESSEREVETELREALHQGLIGCSEGVYRFAHDRVQEAAYSLIAEGSRAEAHLRIGRLLHAHTPPEKHEEVIFEIVNQFNRGADLITSGDERRRVAELNLAAGKRAKASTAYASALQYFIAGETLLKDDPWGRYRDLTFQLELNRAECELLTGEPTVAAERVEVLRSSAANTLELAAAACLGTDVYMTLGQIDRAIAVSLDYLRHLDIDWPPHPAGEQARAEYERIWTLLGGRAIEEIVDFPLMSDPVSIATIEVLNKVLVAALFTDKELLALITSRAVSLSIERGNIDGSCLSFAWLGAIAGARFGDYKNASRFGQLSFDLVEKRDLKGFQAATFVVFAGATMPWMRHFPTCCDVMRQAFEVAHKVGDLAYAAYSRLHLSSLLFAAGGSLDGVQSEAEGGFNFAQQVKFGIAADMANAQLGLIRTLRGLTTNFGSFDHAQFDEADFERNFALQPAITQCWHSVRKLQAKYFAGDFAAAVEASMRAGPLLSVSPTVEMAEYEFYGALARAASWSSADSDQRREHFVALTAHYKQLEIWAEHCPENFADRAALVEAEIARIEGQDLKAQRLYEEAIGSARKNGFVHNEGLAHELAAHYHLAHDLETAGFAHLRNARSCYVRWGAHGKVKRLDERYPHLRWEQTSLNRPTIAASPGQLDVETVVKASQAISSETVLPGLIERLLRVAVEHAGAERGLLILLPRGVRDVEPRIEAEAATGGADKMEVVVRQAPVTPADLLQAALQYVIRTQERVLLDDASADNVYSKDEYVRWRRSKSVLCLPIIKLTRLVGALYLENNLTRGAFTPDRVAVLQLLASQAAISLENAAFYTDLQLQVGILQHLPVSAWTLDPDGTPDFVNQVWLEFSGQTLDFVRSHPEAWMNAVHPDDREVAARSFWEGVHSGKGFAMQTRSLRARDGTYRWHLNQATALRDSEGKVLKFVGTTTDIDNQKRSEEALRQAQSDAARINRVTTMGELAASLAHELNQPISGTMNNAETCLLSLARDTPDLDVVGRAVTRIARDARRAAEIMRRIRSQFKRGELIRELIDVNEIHQETVALLRDQAARYNISVRTELAADLPQIVGDRVQLQQVAMNLIVNGIEAMKDVDAAREIVVKSRRTAGEQILVSVSDTGIGFPPQLADRLFDPFFTTKSDGTGMGLRISRSIIESHGGRLWAKNNDGPGATFLFSIPFGLSPGA